MKFEKWNGTSSSNINNSGSYGNSQILQSDTVGESQDLNRLIWGVEDHGDDITSTMWVHGSIYVNTGDYSDADEEEPEFEYNTRSGDETGGNLYVEKHIESKTLETTDRAYTHNLDYDYQSVKTDLATHQKKQDDRLTYLESLFPIGTILMYAGNIAVPTGWHVCDGTGGTIDLRKKFIRGANSVSEAGNTGGAESVTLGVANLPSHNHSATTTVNLTKSTNLNPALDNVKDQIISTQRETYYQVFDMGGDKHYTLESGYENPTDKGVVELTVGDIVGYVSDINYTASATTTIGYTGSGNSFSILPPYYDVIYIQRIS